MAKNPTTFNAISDPISEFITPITPAIGKPIALAETRAANNGAAMNSSRVFLS